MDVSTLQIEPNWKDKRKLLLYCTSEQAYDTKCTGNHVTPEPAELTIVTFGNLLALGKKCRCSFFESMFDCCRFVMLLLLLLVLFRVRSLPLLMCSDYTHFKAFSSVFRVRQRWKNDAPIAFDERWTGVGVIFAISRPNKTKKHTNSHLHSPFCCTRPNSCVCVWMWFFPFFFFLFLVIFVCSCCWCVQTIITQLHTQS